MKPAIPGKYFIALFLGLSLAWTLPGQVLLNEFICSNASSYLDPESGQFSDWIELYNVGNEPINLEGFFLSDDEKDLGKWAFPPGISIPAQGYLLVFADNLNEGLHLNFGLSKDGEAIYLTGPNGAIHDFVEFGQQKPDVSYGRNQAKPLEWGWFGEPTPGKANSSRCYPRPTENPVPQFFPEAGFYSGPVEVSLTISGNESATIRYTLDGSTPGSDSPIFPRTLEIHTSSTLKVRAFSSDLMPSDVVAKTYLIGVNTQLPVFSISMDPDFLWDAETGIYVDGSNFNGERETRNSCQTDWERPMHIEFFDADGKLAFSEEAGIQVKGRMNCEFPKKPLGIFFRSKYGNDQVSFPFFPEKAISQFSSFILRPGGADGMGNCYNGTMIRDGLLSSLLIDRMDIDYQAYRPAVLFLNGQYWGIHNIRERNKSDYIAANHQVDPNQLDLLENPENGGIIEGDDLHYMGLLNFARSGELRKEGGYEKLETWVDVQELINYQIAEIFVNNEDWAFNNVLCWRPRTDDGRWRWVFFDVEGGFGLYHDNDYLNNLFDFGEDKFLQHAFLIQRLLTNPRFKADFIQGFAAHLNTTFRPERVIQLIDSLSGQIADEMELDVKRWGSESTNGGSGCIPISSMEQWQSHLEIMKNFARERPAVIRQQISEVFHLTGQCHVELIAEGGSISLNGVSHAGSGSYFKGLPINLTAVPEIGYVFAGWEGLGKEPVLEIALSRDTLIKALFVPGTDPVLPQKVEDKLILSASESPYLATSDIIIEENGSLILTPGTRILMPEGASIYVYGEIQIKGSPKDPVIIEKNPSSAERWGALVLDQAKPGSEISHLIIRQASLAHADPKQYKANLNIINCFVRIAGLDISDSQGNPLYIKGARGSVSSSVFHSDAVCDFINVAQSPGATIQNCLFNGNSSPDTDAIDLDAVGPSYIIKNKFRNFRGSNSDGLDIGYSPDVLIQGNVFSWISDKGISVGMGSVVEARNNLFLNCTDGMGIKDANSRVLADRNTFYGNQVGIHCFEKEPGRGGGTAQLVNSVFAGSSQEAGLFDDWSAINFNYCWDESVLLPGTHNQTGNPGFIAPQAGVFRLTAASGCREAGDPASDPDPDGTRSDMGAYYFSKNQLSDVFLNEIIRRPQGYLIEIYNKGKQTIDCDELVVSTEFFGRGELPVGDWLEGSSLLGPNQFITLEIPDSLLSFRKPGDLLLLSQEALQEKILLSSLPYSPNLGTFSMGHYPDGSFQLRHFTKPTAGYSNEAEASGKGSIFINEVLANNHSKNEDWLELYNAGSEDYFLGGLYFTDNLDDPTKHQLPASLKSGLMLESRDFKLFWADGNADAGIEHLSFKLDASKEEVGLFRIIYPDTILIDSLQFANQLPDRSIGRFPDGSSVIKEFTTPTPGGSNVFMHVADSQNLFNISLYPNPCSDWLNIEIKGHLTSKAWLEIINLNGQIMTRLDLQDHIPEITSLSVREYPPGLYIVRAISSGTVQTARLVKE